MVKFYDVLLTLLRPFIMIIGKVGLPKRKFTGEDYYKLRDLINPGDILLTKTNFELSNLVNPCPIKHGAFYVGKILQDEVCYVFESTAEGAVLTDLVTFLTSKDVVICTRLKDHELAIQNIHLEVLRLKGAAYDYLFSFDGKAYYCFELVAACIQNICPSVALKFKEIAKERYIFNHDTFLDEENFAVVFDTRKVKK